MLKGNFPTYRFGEFKTPFYFYDLGLLRDTLDKISSIVGPHPLWTVHYAVKANFNPVILKLIASRGFGADCVSGGEVKAALDAGFAPEGIVYAGVGKTDEEILFSLNAGIDRFNVESVEELGVIDELAGNIGKRARVAIRVNPDIAAHTHSHISTGMNENKFGICMEQVPSAVEEAMGLPNVEFVGLHFHIGSQILDMTDFERLCARINGICSLLERRGIKISDLNVGGGLGINYEHPNHLYMADFQSYFDTFRKSLDASDSIRLHFELGRSIVAPCGSLISRVLYVKEGVSKKFAIVDASMTQLIRPALYDAYHRIENLTSSQEEEIYDVVGPVCESSDIFLKDAAIDCCHRGDLIAIRSAGAYGEAMASNYNCHPLPQSVFSDDLLKKDS